MPFIRKEIRRDLRYTQTARIYGTKMLVRVLGGFPVVRSGKIESDLSLVAS